MTITYTIPGATLLDQLNEPTMDGLPDENADDNCVSDSAAEGLHTLTGQTFDGDELKDAVYGQGYIGFQSAERYVAYCAAHGVTLAAHNGSQSDLVATIHAEVSAGHPVLVTMPSEWGTPYPDPVHPNGSTHVGVAVGVGPGEIRVMNPWHGFWQDEADAWWEPRLCEGQVWIMQKASGVMVPNGWHDDGTTLTAPNGKTVVQGFRNEVLNWSGGWEADNIPVEESVGQAPSSMGLGGTQGTRQTFAYRMLGWSETDGVRNIWMGVMFLRDEDALRQALQRLANPPTPAPTPPAPPEPAPAPLTPQQQADLAAMAALRAAGL